LPLWTGLGLGHSLQGLSMHGIARGVNPIHRLYEIGIKDMNLFQNAFLLAFAEGKVKEFIGEGGALLKV